MCDVTAAVVAGTAVAGAAASSMSKSGGKTSSTTTSNVQPWTNQIDPLQNAFNSATFSHAQGEALGAFQGPVTAGQNSTQQEALGGLTNYARGTGTDLARGVANNASTLLGAASPFVNNATNLATNGAGPANQTAQNVLTGAALGQTAHTTQAGMAGQGATGAAMGNAGSLAAQGMGDGNASIRSAAQGYVDPSITQGTVDASLRDVSRNLNENTLPGLNARAVAGGNLNSSRAGAAEAVARRGAEDRAADISAGIRQDAYNTGLQTATTVAGQQNQLALGANSQLGSLGTSSASLGEQQRQFNTESQIGAATTLGAQDTANRGLNAQTQIAANGQLGNATAMGTQTASAAGALNDANAQRIATAGDAQQAEAQRQIDEQVRAHYNDYNWGLQTNKDFYGIVGDKNWGQSGTSTTTGSTQQPSNIIGGALGGAAMGASLMGGGGGAGIGSSIGALAANTGMTTSNYAPSIQGMTPQQSIASLPAGPSQGIGRWF